MEKMKFVSKMGQWFVFLLLAGLLFGLAYVLGRDYLIESQLLGNDSYSFYSVVRWLSDTWPKRYFWYPKQGGGVSLVGYPTLSAYIVILVDRLSGFDLAQAFKLVGFLSVPLTGVGIMALGWSRLRSIKSGWVRLWVGFLASGLFVLSPVSRIWLSQWGFYAQQVSLVLVPWIVLFFDFWLTGVVDKNQGFWNRLSLVMFLVSFYLGFMTHFSAGAAVLPLLIVIGVTKWWWSGDRKRVFTSLVMMGVVLAGLLGSRYYSYYQYMKQVSLGGFSGYGEGNRQEVSNNSLTVKMMLGMSNPTSVVDARKGMIDMRFPVYVWLLAVVGVVGGFLKSRRVWSWSVYSLVGFILSTQVSLQLFFRKLPGWSLVNAWQGRGFFMVGGVVIPLMAGYGAYSIVSLVVKLLVRRWRVIRNVLVVVGMLALVGWLVWSMYHIPEEKSYAVRVGGYYPYLDLRDIWGRHKGTEAYLYGEEEEVVKDNKIYQSADWIFLRSSCVKERDSGLPVTKFCLDYLEYGEMWPSEELVRQAESGCEEASYSYCDHFYAPLREQLKWSSWPRFEVSPVIEEGLVGSRELFGELPIEGEYRYDLSGFFGSSVMQGPILSDHSQIQLYINTLSLIYDSWNYQGQVMYGQPNQWQRPGVLSELSKWFGLSYVGINGTNLEPLDYWADTPEFEKIGEHWYKAIDEVSLVSLSNKPRVLVISDLKGKKYSQVFKFFTQGGLKYDQAWSVASETEYVDDYSLGELQKFEAVFLYGYNYKSRQKAYNLLSEYVKGGGKLVIDTGWEYEVPDYQLDRAPEFMPFEALSWKGLDIKGRFKIEDESLGVKGEAFGPLIWEGKSWGVSVPKRLKSGAEVILSYDDQPLVVKGEYVKGEVVWIGFNIVAHSEAKDSVEEVRFFGKMMSELLGEEESQELRVEMIRVNPDKVEFRVRDVGNSLYFKESYHPSWQARVGGRKLDIYKAGPRMMLINAAEIKEGEVIELMIKKPLGERVAELVSILIGVGLVVYLVIPKVLVIRAKLPKHSKFKIKNPLRFLTEGEDQDY